MKNSMYKQVGFFFIFEIMVSKERRGFSFMFFPPLSFIFFALLFFFLAVAWFLAVKLNRKFSARQSVGNCTGGNWRSAHYSLRHVILVLGHGADLCHVSCCAESTRGSVTLSGRRTSAGTASSRRSYPPGRVQRRCAAGAYWPGQTL